MLKLKETLLTKRPQPSSAYMAFMVVLFLVLGSFMRWNGSSWMHVTQASIFERHEYVRLFLALLGHADPTHLFSNAISFFILAFFVYGYFGFWAFPFWTILLGALTNLIAVWTYAPNVNLLGASGAVYLLAGFWGMLYVLIERRYRVGMRLLRSLGVAIILLFPTSFQPNVSYRTHLIGFLVGIAWGLIYFILKRKEIRSHEVWVEIEDEEEEEEGREERMTLH